MLSQTSSLLHNHLFFKIFLLQNTLYRKYIALTKVLGYKDKV